MLKSEGPNRIIPELEYIRIDGINLYALLGLILF